MQDDKDKIPKVTNREKLLELFGKDVFRNMMTAEWWDAPYEPKEKQMDKLKSCPFCGG